MSQDFNPSRAAVQLGDETIGSVIYRHARRTPDQAAIVRAHSGDVSFRSLVEQISHVRDVLWEARVGADARIGIVLPSGMEAAVTTVAVTCHAGCVPFHPAISGDEFAREMKRLRLDAAAFPEWFEPAAWKAAWDSRCALFVVSRTEGAFERFGIRCVRPAPGHAQGRTEPSTASEALVLRTSATTGQAKLLPVTHGNMIAQARKVSSFFDVSMSDRAACILPTYYAQGCKTGVLIPLLLGGGVAIPNAGGLDNQGGWIVDLQPTWFSAGPTFLLGLLDALRARSTPLEHRLRFVLSSSAHLSPIVREGIEQVLGVPVLEFYGLSEAGVMAANPPPPRQRKPGTAGRIAEGELIVCDDGGDSAAPGKLGAIFVRGPSVTPGYILDDGPMCDGRRAGWLATGDLGSIDEDGFLTIAGRLGEVINRGGEKISPAEIESTMLLHPEVREAAAFGVAHPRLGENVAMAVVLRPGGTAEEEDLRKFLRERQPAFKVPQRIHLVDALPKGTTGKVLRNALRDIDARYERALAPPAKLLEMQIAEIWQELLKTESVSVDIDFFEAGGDSLLAEQMLLEVESVIDRKIPVEALPDALTIRRIVATAVSIGDTDAALVTKVTEGDGTPFFFCHGDFDTRGFYALKLARLIDPPRPFYLVHAMRDVREGADLSFAAMARQYVPLLLAAMPQGAFRLGGHCNGGLLAFEIARQLMQAGRAVEVVLLVETISINCRWPLRLANWAIGSLAAMSFSAKFRERLAHTGMAAIWRRLQAVLNRVAPALLPRTRLPWGHAGVAYFRAMANYIPPRLDCPVVAITAEASAPDLFMLSRSWRSRVSRLDNATVSGDHWTCITLEVASLAARMGSLFWKADASERAALARPRIRR